MHKALSILVLCGVLMGCGTASEVEKEKEGFVIIEKVGYYPKVYWSETKIMYIKTTHGATPYISKNGKYCRYVDGKIEEVE